MKIKIDQKQFINLYKKNLSDVEMADFFGVSERTISRFAQKLRMKKLIKPRAELVSKTVSTTPVNTDKIEALNWKISKSSVSPNKEKPFKAYIVIADTHVPFVNQPAMKSVLMLMDDIKFDGLIILGDYMDMTPVSHWLQERHQNKALENKRMKQDYIEGNKLLDELDKRLPKDADKRFFYGNHCRFYYDMIEKLPAVEGYFEPKTELKLKERGYKIYDKINHIERIGRLAYTHGMYQNQNFLKTHVDKFMTNVIIGHLHQPRMRTSSSPAKQIATVGYACGCLTDLNPEYMRNKPNAWAHGFAVVYYYKNTPGYFDVDLKRIVEGKFVYSGKMYDGNKK